MTLAIDAVPPRLSSKRRARAKPKSRVRGLSALNPARLRPVMVVGVAVFALVGLALGFETVQISSQSALDQVRSETYRASTTQRDLRSAVSAAEAPSNLLAEAEHVGLIEPAGVAVLPSPQMSAETDLG